MKLSNDLGKDSILSLVFKLAIPAMLSQLVNLLYSIVDRMYIGNIPEIGSIALAGVGVCGPIVTFLASFGTLIGLGGSINMSIQMGAKENEKAKQILSNSFLALSVVSIVLTIIFLLVKDSLIMLFGASEITFPYANTYLTIYTLGSFFAIMAIGLNFFITCQGFATIGMLTVIIGAITNIILDPDTKRGLSPLAPVIPVLNTASEIMQTQILGHKLVSNPPFLAPRGAFHGEIEVKPGKIIEYDPTLLPQMPQPLNFSAMLGGWEFIKFFKSQIERATGVFDNMAGSIQEAGERTATELNYSANGQSARLNWFIDAINRKIIMPLLEKTALTNANFMINNTKISAEIEGKSVTIEITPDVREGNFIYKYSDRKTSISKNSKFKEIQKTISEFSKISSIAEKINWEECFKYTLATLGVENTSKFLLTQEQIAQKKAQSSSQTTKPTNVTEGAKNEIQTT